VTIKEKLKEMEAEKERNKKRVDDWKQEGQNGNT
jgi:hypothetical protein